VHSYQASVFWCLHLKFKALKKFSVPALQQEARVSITSAGVGWKYGWEWKFWCPLFADVTSCSAKLWAGLDVVCMQLALHECSSQRSSGICFTA